MPKFNMVCLSFRSLTWVPHTPSNSHRHPYPTATAHPFEPPVDTRDLTIQAVLPPPGQLLTLPLSLPNSAMALLHW